MAKEKMKEFEFEYVGMGNAVGAVETNRPGIILHVSYTLPFNASEYIDSLAYQTKSNESADQVLLIGTGRCCNGHLIHSLVNKGSICKGITNENIFALDKNPYSILPAKIEGMSENKPVVDAAIIVGSSCYGPHGASLISIYPHKITTLVDGLEKFPLAGCKMDFILDKEKEKILVADENTRLDLTYILYKNGVDIEKTLKLDEMFKRWNLSSEVK